MFRITEVTLSLTDKRPRLLALSAAVSEGVPFSEENSMHQRNILAVALVLLLVAGASAQTSNIPTITLNASVQESLTVTLSGNLVTWSNLDPTAALALNPPDGATTITTTTEWTLRPGRTQL